MKKAIKLLSLFLVLFAVYFSLDGERVFTVFSQKNDNAGKIRTAQARQNDLELAETIERLTNRSMKGLIEKVSANGEVSIDLQERFQNVMLSKLDEDGDPVVACVTGLSGANAFFGRNLKTGEPVEEMPFLRDKTEKLAARHGMTKPEYEFYTSLIEEAAKKRSSSNASAATIVISNNDGAGEGFNDARPAAPEGGNNGTTIGEQRLNVFNFAAGIWGAFLDSGVTITVRAQFDPLTCSATSATLGSAGTNTITANFPNAPFPNTWYHAALANKLRGSDSNPSSQEINATFNSSINNDPNCLGSRRFYYGFDNATPSGTTNLLVVLLHELGHGLGFADFVNGTTGAFPTSSQSGMALPDIYSRFIFDRTLNKYWNEMTDAERKTSSTNNGNVFWDGANVKIASGFLTAGRDAETGRVRLYAPTTYDDGSSISHWDIVASPNLLMEPNITIGLPLTLDLTRQQMRDIGWYRDTNVDLVPDTIINVQTSGGNLAVGSQAAVTWTNTGGFNRNVTIELSTDGGATFTTTIAADIANTGTYTFTVPNNPTTQARIRVREHNFIAPLGSSAVNFTISASAPPAPVLVAGRVTNNQGRGLYKAIVFLTPQGGGETRVTTTNQFGYFRFFNVTPGITYTLAANRKPFTFAPRNVAVNSEVTNLVITPN